VVTDVKFARFLGRYGWTRTEDLLRKFGVPTVFHEWREDALVRTIAECDLAIIPLDLEDPFAAGKPENKLLLLWRLAMPVLTSSTPAYCRAMAGAGLAMTCRTLSEWENAILQFAGNESARQAAGAAGRRYAEVAHSEPQLLAQWDAVFQSLAQTN
jgi:glycosyltransferase involved in cell wall biosynthesis